MRIEATFVSSFVLFGIFVLLKRTSQSYHVCDSFCSTSPESHADNAVQVTHTVNTQPKHSLQQQPPPKTQLMLHLVCVR